ncbi:MAG TPA: hydrogenase maturation peptidase HycI [Candidatus Bathyarchaeota archaeon]|nr:hydrogenase maturation peptidase HycI [Candidatus Bathyarchaeota archaeon]
MELVKQLREWLAGAEKVVVLGVGNPLRRDDAVGLAVARRLKELGADAIEGVCVLEAGSAPENLLGKVVSLKPSHVIIVDAAAHGSRPGSIRLIRPGDARSAHLVSTHTLPLGFLCSYIEREARSRIIVIGIQPADIGLGEGLSPEVDLAARELAKLLYELLASRRPKCST